MSMMKLTPKELKDFRYRRRRNHIVNMLMRNDARITTGQAVYKAVAMMAQADQKNHKRASERAQKKDAHGSSTKGGEGTPSTGDR